MNTQKYLEEMELMSVLDCQHCFNGSAIAQCVECYRDDQDSLMCPDCLNEHLDANICRVL